MNQKELGIAWKNWKKENPKTYDKFQKWNKSKLRKQQEIDKKGG